MKKSLFLLITIQSILLQGVHYENLNRALLEDSSVRQSCESNALNCLRSNKDTQKACAFLNRIMLSGKKLRQDMINMTSNTIALELLVASYDRATIVNDSNNTMLSEYINLILPEEDEEIRQKEVVAIKAALKRLDTEKNEKISEDEDVEKWRK